MTVTVATRVPQNCLRDARAGLTVLQLSSAPFLVPTVPSVEKFLVIIHHRPVLFPRKT